MLAFGLAGFFAKFELAADFFEKLERLALVDVTMMGEFCGRAAALWMLVSW